MPQMRCCPTEVEVPQGLHLVRKSIADTAQKIGGAPVLDLRTASKLLGILRPTGPRVGQTEPVMRGESC